MSGASRHQGRRYASRTAEETCRLLHKTVCASQIEGRTSPPHTVNPASHIAAVVDFSGDARHAKDLAWKGRVLRVVGRWRGCRYTTQNSGQINRVLLRRVVSEGQMGEEERGSRARREGEEGPAGPSLQSVVGWRPQGPMCPSPLCGRCHQVRCSDNTSRGVQCVGLL